MKKLLFLLALMCAACTTNRQILKAVNGLRADFMRIDSVTKTNQIFYNYEKSRIDSTYKRISDDDLRKRVEYLSRPKN
jgi:hypothetical protein